MSQSNQSINYEAIEKMQQIGDSALIFDHWTVRLLLILLGYSSVILPFYYFINYISRRCKEDDEFFRKNLFKTFIRYFAYGRPEYQLVNMLDRDSKKEAPLETLSNSNTASITMRRKNNFFKDCIRVIVYFFGIQSSLVCMGFFQEKIITQKYAKIGNENLMEKFDDAQFLVFANRIVAFCLSGSYLFYDWYRQPVHIPPLYAHSFTSISNTISSWCQYEALKYVSFPTQTVCKASKVIPTMLMGRIMRNQRYTKAEYSMALLLVTGASIFFVSLNINSKSIATTKDGGALEILNQHSTTISGLVLMFGYLMFDSFTPNYQKKLLEARVSCCQMMFYVNAFSAILCLVSLLQQMTLFSSSAFILTHSNIFLDCFLLSLGSALGQIFIYMTIDEFGPVVLSIMMTLRQIFSLILSSVYFQHPISLMGVFGLSLVFGAILGDTYRKYFINKRKTKH